MNPDLKATCLFCAQLVSKLPSPALHLGMAQGSARKPTLPSHLSEKTAFGNTRWGLGF